MTAGPTLKGTILPLLLLGTALCTACRGDGPEGDPSLILDVSISPTPPAVGSARLIISLQDTAGTPLSDAEIIVEGNMSHAGMVPVLDTARMLAPGQYSIPDFQFTMAGDWILTLTATLPDGRTTTARKGTDVASVPGQGQDSSHHSGGHSQASRDLSSGGS